MDKVNGWVLWSREEQIVLKTFAWAAATTAFSLGAASAQMTGGNDLAVGGAIYGAHFGVFTQDETTGTFSGELLTQAFSADIDFEFERAFAAGGTYGIVVGGGGPIHWILEGDVTYRSSEIESYTLDGMIGNTPIDETDVEFSSDFATLSTMGNVLVSMPIQSLVRAYGGVGAGYIFSLDDNLKNDLGWQAKAGIDFDLGFGGRLGAEYVYIEAFDGFEGEDNEDTNLDYSGHTVMFTYRLTQ